MISLSHASIKAVKLPPFSKRILLTFNDHGSHVIPKVGVANYPVLHI